MAAEIIKLKKDGELTTENANALDAFVASLDVMPKSRDTYERATRQYLRYIEDRGVALGQTVREDVMGYKEWLLANRSAATCGAYLTAVRRFYAWLHDLTGYPNVAEGIKGPKRRNSHSKDALTATQAARVLNNHGEGEAELRDHAMLALMITRGLRTIEVVRANVGDLRNVGGRRVLYVQGKGHEAADDFVVLGGEAEAAIDAYLMARGPQALDAPLFASVSPRNRGGRMTTRSVSRIAKEAFKEQGIDTPRITAHSCRHTAVTLSLQAGATVQEAQSMARHADISTTLVYAHNLEKLDARAESAIDELLAAAI